MNILNEIWELRDIFLLFCDDINEEKFVYKSQSNSFIIDFTATKYYFTLKSEESLKKVEKKIFRIKTFVQSKKDFFDEKTKKNLEKYLRQIERNTLSKGSDLETKNEFKLSLLNSIGALYDILENLHDFIWEPDLSENKFVNNWTIYNSWNFAVENKWDQNIKNLNNQIDEIIKIIDSRNIEQKDEIKKLLEDFKKSQNPSLLVEVFNTLWTSASIASFLIPWILKIISGV